MKNVPLSSQSILIVDDEEDIRNLLAMVLRDKGFSVRTASNGKEALESISREKPSLVILDLMMPEMSGEDVCRIIKEDPALRDIFIVVLSGKDDLQSKLHSLNLGAEEYLVKPIDMEELVARVSRFLSLMNQWLGADQKQESLPTEPSDSAAQTILQDKTIPTFHLPSVADAAGRTVAPDPPAYAVSAKEHKSNYGVYRIESLAGVGGMGLVFKAHDEVLDRYVAVKVLSKEWSSSPDFLKRFHTEAKLIAAINHPGIAQIYTFAEEEGESYFALQWCPGGSLANLIRREGKIDLLSAIDIILQCVRGLEAASMKGVVHRDIKPSNIMFDENQQIRIVDFGVASSSKMPEGVSEPRQVIGSPAYMAPEQGHGATTDHRTDMYSLGVTFYQMLYGRLPFSAQSPWEWVEKHTHTPFPSYDDLGGTVSLKAYQIIEKMTRKDPAARYKKYSDLIKDLEKLRNELYSQRRLKIPTPVEVSRTAIFRSNNFFELLANVFRQERSGVLKVSWERLQKKFLIFHNEIVCFESPQPDENFWTVLVNRKLMKKEEVLSADEDLEESLNRLLFLQAFTPEDFKATYREMMMQSVLQVFQWPVFEGEFLNAKIEHDAFSRISIARILMDAARTMVPYEAVSHSVPQNQFIVRTPKFEEVLTLLNLPRAESFLASRLEGTDTTVETLQWLTGLPVEQITRTVYAFERMGAVEYRSPVERQSFRKVAESVPEPKTVSSIEAVPISDGKSVQKEIVELRGSVKTSTPKRKWIESPPSVDVQAAARAYRVAEEKYNAGHYWEVERLCVRAIKNNPAEAKYHHLMALALAHHQRSIKVAEESFRQAIHLDPSNLQYRFDLASFLKDHGRLDVALHECEKMLEMSPYEAKVKSLLKEIEQKDRDS